MPEYETILVEQRGRVGWITLNRPEALNALNAQMSREVADAVSAFDRGEQTGAVVITGSPRAFAAGADIKEMESMSSADMLGTDHFGAWRQVADVRIPLVAAVAGYALGGGCELAMMCDIVLAAESARFGQPEIALGVIPGMGGTQRLARVVGHYRAAELVLTGRTIDAAEAERIGLASRVVADADLLGEAETVAAGIAARSLPSVHAAKAALSAAREVPLSEGLEIERRAFASLFDTADQKEGMAAFREKRQPLFRHR